MNIILTVGIDGSGKSTWAKEFLKENPSYIRICRNEIERIFHKKESIANMLFHYNRDNLMQSAYNLGMNIIIDDNNLHIKDLNSYVNVKNGREVQFKIFDTNPTIAKYRTLEKNHKELFKDGEATDLSIVDYIDKQHEDFLKIKEYISENYSTKIL